MDLTGDQEVVPKTKNSLRVPVLRSAARPPKFPKKSKPLPPAPPGWEYRPNGYLCRIETFSEPEPSSNLSRSERVLAVATRIAKTRAAKEKYKNFRKANHSKCELCNVSLNAQSSRTKHLNGRKHKAAVRRQAAGDVHCYLCNRDLKTVEELAEHKRSKRHLRLIEEEKDKEKHRAWKARRDEHYRRLAEKK